MDTITRWNEAEGVLWAAEADRFDRIGAAHIGPLLSGAGVAGGWQMLDVGCGAGATTRAAAASIGRDGHIIGIDVSEPLLAVARLRASGWANVAFVEGDATTHPYPPARFDAIISRSAVQLFADPVAGLAHLRPALRRAGRLAFTVWREAARNGWSAIPAEVIGRHLPNPDPPPTRGPGAFALADPDRLAAIVEASGFVGVGIEALEHDAVVGEDVDDALGFFDRVAGGALRLLAPPHVIDRIAADLREAIAPYTGPTGVALPASAWLVTASAE